jgi:hypothetical protein
MAIHVVTQQEFEENSNQEIIREIILLEHEKRHSQQELDDLVRKYRYERINGYVRDVSLYNIAKQLEEHHGFVMCPMTNL